MLSSVALPSRNAFCGNTRSLRQPTVRATGMKRAATMQKETFDPEWINANDHLLVIGSSLAAWTAATSTPMSNGDTLFNAFHSAMIRELANFPQGPALDNDIWLYMTIWHFGLFVVMTLGTIGVQGRKQGYFN